MQLKLSLIQFKLFKLPQAICGHSNGEKKLSKFTQEMYLSKILRYLLFTWVLLFYSTLYLNFTTFQLHIVLSIPLITSYF